MASNQTEVRLHGTDTQWFVDFLSNPQTRELIDDTLGKVVEDTLMCRDGFKRHLCYFPEYRALSCFKAEARKLDLPFKVYLRKGEKGDIYAEK